jgi:hypothetical protein
MSRDQTLITQAVEFSGWAVNLIDYPEKGFGDDEMTTTVALGE